jgi:hypothetical protein
MKEPQEVKDKKRILSLLIEKLRFQIYKEKKVKSN